MPNEDDVADVVAALYDAAAGVGSWPEAMKRMATALGAQSGLLFTPKLTGKDGIFLGYGLDPAAFEAYGAYYHTKDLWYQAGARGGVDQRGALASGHALVDRKEFDRSEWRSDFLKPLDIYHMASLIVVGDTSPRLPRTHTTFFRPERGPEFAPPDLKLLGLFHPHLERAMTIHVQMEGHRATARGFTDVLDRLSAAIVVLQAGARIAFVNKAAESILSAGDGLLRRAAGLRALARDDDTRLQRALRLASEVVEPLALAAAKDCTISRPSGRRPYQVIVAPLPRDVAAESRAAARAVAFIIDPESQQEVPAERIARLLHLTPAEARLTAALASGTSLAEYAERAGISLGTARWTLKQALAKTGTEKQSALVALVLRTAIVRGIG